MSKIDLHNKKQDLLLALMVLVVGFIIYGMATYETESDRVRKTKAERRAEFVEDSLSLKIGVLPTSDCDVINLASELGIFDSLGVTVHLRHYNALSECRHALRLNLVEGAVVDSLLAQIIENKDTTKLFLSRPTPLSWKLIASKKSRVLRVSQLVDKIVGADSHGVSHVMAEQAIDSLLKKQHLAFIVQVEDPKIRYNMLSVGNIDAAMLPEPFATKALKEGHKLLLDRSKETKGVIAFRDKALKDKRIKEQYELFLKGLDIAADSLAKRKQPNS